VVHLQEGQESDKEGEDVYEVDIQSSDQSSDESDSSVSVVPAYHLSKRKLEKATCSPSSL
jgi:predicted DNA-binding protein (MmcQ/YjbR family)